MLFLDIVLYKIACWIWPDEPRTTKRGSSGENSANWIILDDLERDGKLQDKDNDDPLLNGEYDGGPDW